MHSCKLDQPVFVGATEFEFEETEEGFLVHTFVISNQVNANNWMVTNDANRQDGKDFEGKPDILFINEKGIKDHTTGKTKEESLRVQEPFRKGTIKKIKGTDVGRKLTATSKIDDEKTKQLIRSHDVRFVSPAIFPKSLEDVEIVRTGPDTHIHIIHRYDALHVAFVDEPAYGIDAAVGPICEGNVKDCMIRLQQIQAGIGDDEVEPLREVKLVTSKCTKTGNLIFELPAGELNDLVSKCLSDKLGPGVEPTPEDLAICFSEAREMLKKSKAKESKQATTKSNKDGKYSKGTLGNEEEKDKETIAKLKAKAQEVEEEIKGLKKSNEELTEEKKKTEETAKKAEEEEKKKTEEARKSGKGKKAEDMTEEEKKAAQDEEEEKKAQEDEKKEKDIVAKVASEMSIKSPLVEKYIQAKTAQKGLDEKAQSELRIKMLSASVEDIESKIDDIGAFAGLSKLANGKESPIGQGGVPGDGSYSASTKYDDLSGEDLEEAAMGATA